MRITLSMEGNEVTVVAKFDSSWSGLDEKATVQICGHGDNKAEAIQKVLSCINRVKQNLDEMEQDVCQL